MRNNQPVTRYEYKLRENDFLISRTNRGGRITYANAAFVEVSGFERDELIGSPHNIVRHPDMPREAFKDLWDTLKAGETWTGLVKNRRKNGDCYWVKARVAPILENGEVHGYVSMRTKASRADIAGAEKVYKQLREGRGDHLLLRRGQVRRKGLSGLLDTLGRWRLDGFQARLGLIVGAAALLMLAIAGLGLQSVEAPEPGRQQAMLLGGLWLAGVGVLAALAAWAGRALRHAARQSLDFTLQIAAGNLAAKAPRHRRDEMGSLAEALEVMRKSLGSIAGDVSRGVTEVTPAAQGVAEASRDLATRTQEQASFLQQTAGSMEQILAAVRQNADNAQQASELSGETSGAVTQGSQAMREVVQTMERITASSKQMTAIIDTIDAIAFQTNILALNASVEAARAGAQGRGFAVVAGEVRSLAARSTGASKEVRELISRSSGEVEQGADRVREAGDAMSKAEDAVDRVSSLMGEIAAASSQQSKGVEDINHALSRMDELTRENAGRVRESADAAAVLSEQASALSHSVAVFRLQGAGTEGPEAVAPA